MPEGDTLWRTARRLHRALAGHPLVLADLRWAELSEEPLRGAHVEEVLARGKHLLHRVSGEAGPWTLHTHLRMDGSWRIEAAGSAAADRMLRRPDLRAALGSAEWSTFGLDLGEVDLVRRADEHLLVAHLGPDVMDADWDRDEVITRMRSRPSESIASSLLDQRHLAGVGTFWASEALFALRMYPWRPVDDLSDEELEVLLDRIRALMLRGREHAVQSATGILRQDARANVHARSGRPCRRCGESIRVAPLGRETLDRVFFSCPGCQGGLAPTDDGRPQAPLGARRRR